MNIKVSDTPIKHGSYVEDWLEPKELKKYVRKMGRRLIANHGQRIEENPHLRFVSVTTTDKRPTGAMIFHSEDGINWVAQPGLIEGMDDFAQFYPKDFNLGAERLDGDDLVSNSPTRDNALLRLGVGRIDYGEHASFQDMLDYELDELREEIGHIFVDGAQSYERKLGREATLITINRTIDQIARSLSVDPYEQFTPPPLDSERTSGEFLFDRRDGSNLAGEYELYLARRRYPFISNLNPLGEWPKESKTDRNKRKAGFWADACGLPHGANRSEIHGRLIAISKGHPIFGDDHFNRLAGLLQECLERGQHVVLLGDRLFVRRADRWRAYHREEEGTPTWTEGVVKSNNFGRLIVPPFYKDGELQNGYTRNSAGEGKSKPRPEPEIWKVAHRELAPSDLAWVHALHDWDLAQE